MAKKVALTPASIDALQKGTLGDLLTPGLVIEVLGTGKKRWRYRRQVAGTTIMGHPGAVSLTLTCLRFRPLRGARETRFNASNFL